MNEQEAKERAALLTAELNQHNYRYYVLSQSSISDYDFDMLLKELEALEADFPELRNPNSPTQRVGGEPTKDFRTLKHRYPMLSLGNTYSREELMEWDARVQKGLGEVAEYVCELKFDGLSISLNYKDGQLVQALTRGDSTQGDEVTNNVRTIKSIPLTLQNGNWPADFEIRGEIFMHRSTFDELNRKLAEELREKGLDEDEIKERLYKNPRNFASGTLKQQDPADVAKRSLDAFIYFLYLENRMFDTHYQSLQAAKEWGFKVSEHTKVCKSLDEIYAFIDYWDLERHKLGFEIDGVVIKVNNYHQQEELGFTAKMPKWAIAYKFKSESAATILEKITYQVGRTGAITPVANLKPVVLAGTTVKRATLHNADEIERLDLREGDTVFVEKGGEIIPKITGVDLEKRTNPNPHVYITHCPDCGTQLTRNEGEVVHYCPNEDGCSPQRIGKIVHFIGRRAMYIDSLGAETIEGLYKKGLISNSSDLYSLTFEKLHKLEFDVDPSTSLRLPENDEQRTRSLQEKSVNNILAGIEKSKQIPFERLLFALGIRMVGETVAKKLAKHFKDIDTLMSASMEELTAVHEIGEKIAENLTAWIAADTNKAIIQKLKEAGLKLQIAEDENTSTTDKLQGKTFVISGVFVRHSRDELKALIENNGGRSIGSISKSLNYLLAGDKMGPEKLKKATDLNIPIISEEDFEAMLG